VARAGSRADRLGPLLEGLERAFDKRGRIGFDPVEFPRRYPSAADQEVAGLIAAALAYGRAELFKPQLTRIFAEMDPSPARFCDDLARSPRRSAFDGFLYRFNRPPDLAALAAAAGHLRRAHGSLGERFTALLREERASPEPLRHALARFARELREAPPARALLEGRGARGLAHLLPAAEGAGACKRWNLYLRWMVRGPDEVDLGIWPGVPRSSLVVPLDTHVARIARHLGLTRRRDLSWRTAAEITAGLRRIDPDDPTRFDFVLCHLGMSGACPLRRDPRCCAACTLNEACLARARRSGSATGGRS
jgi:uncharacterized protein (TIGR02757 family)